MVLHFYIKKKCICFFFLHNKYWFSEHKPLKVTLHLDPSPLINVDFIVSKCFITWMLDFTLKHFCCFHFLVQKRLLLLCENRQQVTVGGSVVMI